jgi:acyl dehydratase
MNDVCGPGVALSFFDDVQIGQRFRSGTCEVSAESIRAFAAQYDPQPLHLDAEAARASIFGALIASGWQTAAITMRLTLDGGPRFASGTVGLGAEVSWQRPVRAGDTLYAAIEIIEKIPSQSRADRGRIIMRIETCNQRDEVVQLLTAKVLVPRRASASA